MKALDFKALLRLLLIFSSLVFGLASHGQGREREDLALEIIPREVYVYVGVGWRLVYQVSGTIDKSSLKLQSQLILEKYWPVQEELTKQYAGPWSVEAIRAQADTFVACKRARDEKKDYSNRGEDLRVMYTSDGKLTIIAGHSPQPEIRAEIPGSEVEELAKVVQELVAFEEAVNHPREFQAKENKTAIAEIESHPKKSDLAFQIRKFSTYSAVRNNQRFIYEIRGGLGWSGLVLEGAIQFDNKWTGSWGPEIMQEHVEVLKSCDKAFIARKSMEKQTSRLWISLAKNGVITLRSSRYFIDAEIPGADAKGFAEGLKSVLTLEHAVNQRLKQQSQK